MKKERIRKVLWHLIVWYVLCPSAVLAVAAAAGQDVGVGTVMYVLAIELAFDMPRAVMWKRKRKGMVNRNGRWEYQPLLPAVGQAVGIFRHR